MKSDLHFDGRSLVPLIKGTSDNWPERTVIIDNQRILYPRKFRKTAVMTEQYRWVNGKELYDIIKDPGQKKDIHEQHPELIKKIEAEYNDWWSDVYPDLK